jgi:hypothetical protein
MGRGASLDRCRSVKGIAMSATRASQCVYWRHPGRVRGPMKELFELVEAYADESHLRRYLLRCRECGQLYFYEFYEEIDWVGGNDPQYVKYVPVGTAADGARLARRDPSALSGVSPRLCIDFPKEAKEPVVYWVGREE